MLPISAPLHCHPSTGANAVAALAVTIARSTRGLTLHYCLHGDLDRIDLPPPGPGGCADGLWRGTCFEAFVAAGTDPAYREFNFAPSGQWADYAFTGYRRRDPAPPPGVRPVIRTVRKNDCLELVAHLDAAQLPVGTLDLGLTAVVADRGGRCTYWALCHTGDVPDFHRRDSFSLHLPALEPAPDP